ncbi:Signal transduction response regulator [Parasponia andersonii]|uniref:Signal transduction response regulator n=1 Tax=Parasponia andersonii TaxID=3476 RepID=A0A2P5BHP1_PARAD|nr:Signal transduction response regulator [Parasponia andersonii]
MKAVLIRTGSVPVQVQSPHVSGSPRVCLSRSDSLSGVVFSGEKAAVSSPKLSLHFEINRRRKDRAVIRRSLSETDMIGSKTESAAGSRSFPARIPEEEESAPLSRTASFSGIPLEEIGISGGGFGRGSRSGGGGGFGDRSKLGEYYQEMLKANPSDSLLLRNYGKYLHVVEKDLVRAEEYYARAILANPGDGELLSLYGKLIWETQRDEDRAKSYFDQALAASPDDCTVLGSFAHFMWEAEENDEEEMKSKTENMSSRAPALVPAF